MQSYFYQFALPCLVAMLIDTLIGDPRFYPHPVRFLGFLNQQYENLCRKLFPKKLIFAGFCAVSLVIGTAIILAYLIMQAAAYIDRTYLNAFTIDQDFGFTQLACGSLLIYVTIAAKDLSDHAVRILRPLQKKDLDGARNNLAMIVGRDTEDLNEAEISRATIESIAENTVDGITSPLFYGLIFGPFGAVVYRAINTMDSMYAYKNDKYLYFGRCAAYLDDTANFLPARLTGLCMCAVAPFCGGSLKNAWSIMRRDGQKHPSPNSGISEAAVAGALGIQLGGPSTYAGVLSNKQTLGEAKRTIDFTHIKRAIAIMYSSYFFFTFIVLCVLLIFYSL